MKLRTSTILLVSLAVAHGCQCGPLEPAPASASSIFCTCQCDQLLSAAAGRESESRIEVCLTPDDLVDGGVPSRDAVVARCKEVCEGVVSANALDVTCLFADREIPLVGDGGITYNPCQLASCSLLRVPLCTSITEDPALVFDPDDEGELPAGAVMSYGFEAGCRDMAVDGGPLKDCPANACNMENLVNQAGQVCGDGIVQGRQQPVDPEDWGNEDCDGRCGVLNRNCPAGFVGERSCNADCTINNEAFCVPEGQTPPPLPGDEGCREIYAAALEAKIGDMIESTQCTTADESPIAHCDDGPAERLDAEAAAIPACIAPQVDPPIIERHGLGVLSFSGKSDGVVDPDDSSVHVVAGGGPAAGVATRATGRLELIGRACPNGGCSVGASFDLVLAPFTVAYRTPTLGLDAEVHFGATMVTAQTTADAITIDAAADGTLAADAVAGTVRAHLTQKILAVTVADQKVAFVVKPDRGARASIDFAARTFSFSATMSAPADEAVDRPELDVVFDIRGTLTRIAPVAEAGPRQTVTCMDSGATPVTLDGSGSFDLDGAIGAYAWFRDVVPLVQTRVGMGATVTVDQPLGERSYLLGVADEALTIDWDVTTVVVEEGPAPVAVIANHPQIECTSPEGAAIVLSAAGTADPLGRELARFEWRLGGADGPLLGTGAQLAVFLPFGESAIHLSVENACGGTGQATATLTVADTTPPTIDEFSYVGPVCLWPPNHDYAVLDLERDVDAVIRDTCDPAPVLRFTSVASSQPDDANADGATTVDTLLFDDHVCLRAERQGTLTEPRMYIVGLHAFDRFGNASDPLIDVEVRHDQRASAKCTDAATEGADDGDPRCTLLETSPVAAGDEALLPPSPVPGSQVVPAENDQPPAPQDGTSSSCTTAGAASPLILAGVLLLVRRRRSRARVLTLLLALTAALGCEARPSSFSSLDECLLDVWQSRLPLSCDYDCDRDPTLAECDDDCEVRDFMWLKRDGESVDGYYRASRSRHVFSSAGFSVRPWSLDGDRIVLGVAGSQTVRCDDEKMVLDTTALRVRAPEGTGAAFEGAFDDGGWIAAPYLQP